MRHSAYHVTVIQQAEPKQFLNLLGDITDGTLKKCL